MSEQEPQSIEDGLTPEQVQKLERFKTAYNRTMDPTFDADAFEHLYSESAEFWHELQKEHPDEDFHKYALYYILGGKTVPEHGVGANIVPTLFDLPGGDIEHFLEQAYRQAGVWDEEKEENQ